MLYTYPRMTTQLLTPTQKYASATLFALALHQAQVHLSRPLGLLPEDDDDGDPIDQRISSGSSSCDSVQDDSELWVNETSGLLRPIFKVFEIDPAAWTGIEETAGSFAAKHHIGAYLRLLSEEEIEDTSSDNKDQELALSKAADAMALSMESATISDSKKEKNSEYKSNRREKCSIPETPSTSTQEVTLNSSAHEVAPSGAESKLSEESLEEERKLSSSKKIVVLYELLSACLANLPDGSKKPQQRRGYDARHRVALRLLATWFDIKWVKVEALETMIACSAMALVKEAESKQEENETKGSSWAKWKRGGIIGAAAVTGGALMALTGGLAAPAIAAGFGALAPTLGTIIPVIGASGFAAAASAAGTVAGSVAIAASFGAAGAGLTGSKMAKRTGSVDEFEFLAVGENHKQGRLAVGIVVSGFVFSQEDFIMPWEGLDDNLERYALQWESENLIAVSSAIQDWLTSRLAMELMKQGAMMTVLSTLMTALAWPAALLSVTDFIDSKWSIAVDRSDKAGKLLADVLLKGLQGNRPVTLVGYSLGARVIFKCLQFLAETDVKANLVERVVLLGAPISIKGENWEAARKVVAGRFVNAYSTNDWILGVSFRASLLTKGLAGIQAVEVPGVENVNVTDIIAGHSTYLWATEQILDQLELDSYFPVFRNTPTGQ